MKLMTTLMMAGATTLVAILPAMAADEKAPTISRGYLLKVKPGHTADFEAGMKQQIEWYKQNNEAWHWHTWQWETGENTGQFVFRSPGHQWKDIDDRSERTTQARAHFEKAVGPYLESIEAGLDRLLPNVSNWPEDLKMVPMVSVYEFNLHYGMTKDFVELIKTIDGAIKKSNWGVHYVWIARVSGGEIPTFLLVVPRKNWADMEGPEKPFDEMLKETLGEAQAESVLAGLKTCVRKSTAALARFRPDLSYIPAGDSSMASKAD